MIRPAFACRMHKSACGYILVLTAMLLSGCSSAVLDPVGAVGEQQKNLILLAFGLMLTIVIPVIVLTFYFSWYYRASNKHATYKPDWAESKWAEMGMWGIPLALIIVLSVVTWVSTHKLDPYKPLSDEAHLKVQVVSLDWKWLFIYPDYGVASVNELVIPKDIPVSFDLTSGSVMNSFFIPRLGSQIYTMAGMKTQLHLVANETGNLKGISSNFSGAGFANMQFNAKVVADQAAFERWVTQTKAGGEQSQGQGALTMSSFEALSEPSQQVPVRTYSSLEPKLFDKIMMKVMKNYGETPFYEKGSVHPQAPRLLPSSDSATEAQPQASQPS